jgi:hypothetical protein
MEVECACFSVPELDIMGRRVVYSKMENCTFDSVSMYAKTSSAFKNIILLAQCPRVAVEKQKKLLKNRK